MVIVKCCHQFGDIQWTASAKSNNHVRLESAGGTYHLLEQRDLGLSIDRGANLQDHSCIAPGLKDPGLKGAYDRTRDHEGSLPAVPLKFRRCSADRTVAKDETVWLL